MGFNPRLAPYSVTYQTNPFAKASATRDIDWFRFPFAGQLLSAYASVDTNIATDATTAITTLSIGKSLAGTGAYAAVASRVVTAGADGASTYDNTTQYTLSVTSTGATKKFAAGDWAMLRLIHVHSSGAYRGLTVQMDYVIGHEI